MTHDGVEEPAAAAARRFSSTCEVIIIHCEIIITYSFKLILLLSKIAD